MSLSWHRESQRYFHRPRYHEVQRQFGNDWGSRRSYGMPRQAFGSTKYGGITPNPWTLMSQRDINRVMLEEQDNKRE